MTNVSVRKITDNTVEYEDSGHESHIISADIVTVCAEQRKVGLDLYEQLLKNKHKIERNSLG